jgi:hypothetical protein
MTDDVIDIGVSSSAAAAVALGAERPRRAAELTRTGTPVRFLRTISVPEDARCIPCP